MQHATQVALLRELIERTERGENVDAGRIVKNPVRSYVCPELAAREWQVFFREHPQLVGLSCDLPEAGSFFTLNDFGSPVLATRDADGRFRAFLNSCRHRGAMIEARECGTARAFSCPFHGWTYTPDGRLNAVPERGQFGEFDSADFSLLELPALEQDGLLWVHAQPDGVIEPAALLDGLAEEIADWNFGALTNGGTVSYDMPLNWKLANDTFGETYHFKRLHKDSLAQVFIGDCQTWDRFGRNQRMAFGYRSILGLKERPEREWKLTDGAFLVYYLFPNVQMNIGETGLTLVRIYPHPGDPGRSVSRITFYIRPELLALDPDRINMRVRGFGEIVESEDYATGVTTQVAANAGTMEYVIFGRNEPGLHHFHETFRAALELPPLETLS